MVFYVDKTLKKAAKVFCYTNNEFFAAASARFLLQFAENRCVKPTKGAGDLSKLIPLVKRSGIACGAGSAEKLPPDHC